MELTTRDTALSLERSAPPVRDAGAPPLKKDKKTIIVFSGDLDKALAAFIIATGAAAMGSEVTMFFTFWGLNVIRRPEPVPVKKPFIQKMFERMMPRGAERLPLSKMNFAGMGPRLMKSLMKQKNVSSLPEMIETARALGVKMIACTTSMEVMGITKEELIDGTDLAGVATYLGEANSADVNLFIS